MKLPINYNDGGLNELKKFQFVTNYNRMHAWTPKFVNINLKSVLSILK